MRIHLSSPQILSAPLEIAAENQNRSRISALIEEVLDEVYPSLVILSYRVGGTFFISHHISYQPQLYLQLVYHFAEMVEPILRQLRACQQNHFCVGVELICIADHLNVVLRAIIHPNNNVFMEGGRDGQLAEVHMSNPQPLFLPRHQKISIGQKHNLLLRPLLSNNLTSYRANMEQHISALAIEKTIGFLQA